MDRREDTLAERTHQAIRETPPGVGLRITGFILFAAGFWMLGTGINGVWGPLLMVAGAFVMFRGGMG